MFELVWSTLVGVLGTAATATMFRRAARNAATRRPELLHGFSIVREQLEYGFVLPPSWNGASEESFEALRVLVRQELCPLLEELTGPVVLRLLERQPELVRCKVVGRRGEP